MNKELNALRAIRTMHNSMRLTLENNAQYDDSDNGFVNDMMRKIDKSRLNVINLVIELTDETLKIYGINLDGDNGQS